MKSVACRPIAKPLVTVVSQSNATDAATSVSE
jgi:hypothetical protein